ncbi:uncharacterized protein TNCV_4909161 [Trichonephila clavipes]|uniref:Uncharacterized protein n=1 Tax=Trichonephila clavipes TaxID=2585209 RepID=A0A8X6RNU2_TRICX|nr:uncharacterized protein TNCV_4909161 [Trichonephila clavipes]
MEESDPVDDETDADEDSNNESSMAPSNADAFSVLETVMEWYEQQSELFPATVAQENRSMQRKNEVVQWYGEKYGIIFHNKCKTATFCTYLAISSSTLPVCDDFQYSYSVRFHILHESHSVFGYPNNRVSERCPVPIDSDKRRSSAIEFNS